MRTLFPIIALVALITLPLTPALAEITGVVVVRHAEKADDGTRDPFLATAGRARADTLALVLENADVAGLIATQYQRTQQTLATLARQRGLDVTVVPAEPGGIEAHIEAIASKVRECDAEGVLVIAGHSNTVPLIVEALSGRVVSPISEWEYDRMFILLPGKAGMEVIKTRYGAESAAKRY